MYRIICPRCKDNDSEGWRIHFAEELEEIKPGIWAIGIEIECRKCGKTITWHSKMMQELAEDIGFNREGPSPKTARIIFGFLDEKYLEAIRKG